MVEVIDTLVDNYLPILLQLEHDIDMIEDSVFDNTTETAMEKILHALGFKFNPYKFTNLCD